MHRVGQQRQHPAFSAVIEAQHEGHVLERDDQRHCPEHQRQHRVDVVLRERNRVGAAERLLESVEGTRADVAIDHPEGGQGEGGGAGPLLARYGHVAA
jgi:hypothetical protein